MKHNGKITLVVTAIIIVVFTATMPISNYVSDKKPNSQESYQRGSNDNSYTPYRNKSEEYTDQEYYY